MFVFVILNPNPSLVEFTDTFDNLALTSDIYSIPLESDKDIIQEFPVLQASANPEQIC